MKRATIIVRKILKAPLLVVIVALSRMQGFKMYDRWWVPQKLEHLFGLYEPETTRFFKKHIKQGMVVADIGANVGYYTRLFSKLVGKEGKVYAFEPDAEAYEFLRHNTQGISNIKIFPYAVSDADGEANFYHIPKATSSHTLVPTEHAVVNTVKTVCLDSFVPEKIDVMKIDIEGAEDKVFRGMEQHLERDSPWIVFEYTVGEGDPLVERLKQKGNIYSITSKGEPQPFDKANFYATGRGGNPYANIVYKGK